MDPTVPSTESPDALNPPRFSLKKIVLFVLGGVTLVVAGFLIYNSVFAVARPPSLSMGGGLQGFTGNLRTGFLEYQDTDAAGYIAPNGLVKNTFTPKNDVVYLYSDVDVSMKDVLYKYIVQKSGMAVLVGYWNPAQEVFVTSQSSIWPGQIKALREDQLASGDGIIPAYTGFFIVTNKPSIDIYGVKSPSEMPAESFDVVKSGNIGWNLVTVTKWEYEKLKNITPSSTWRYSNYEFVKEETIDSSRLDNYLVWLQYEEKPAEIDVRVRAKVEAEVKAVADKAEQDKLAAEKVADDAAIAKANAEEVAKSALEAKAKAEADAKIIMENADKAVAAANGVADSAQKNMTQANDIALKAEEALQSAMKMANEATAEAKADAEKAVADAQAEVEKANQAKIEAQQSLDNANAEIAKAKADAIAAKEEADKAVAEAEQAKTEAQAVAKNALAAQAAAEKALQDMKGQIAAEAAQKLADAQVAASAATSVDYSKALLYLPFEKGDLTANKGTSSVKNVMLGGTDGEVSMPVQLFDHGMYFDGVNDYITVGKLGLDWTLNDWSMSAWAEEDAGAVNNWRGIISNRSSSDLLSWVTLGTRSNGHIVVEVGDRSISNVKVLYLDSGSMPAGQGLNHYVVTHDAVGQKLSLYINGKLVGSSLDISGLKIGDAKNSITYVGKWVGQSQSWDGEIKYPAVYGSALSPEQVNILYGKIDQNLVDELDDSDLVAGKLAKLSTWYNVAWGNRKLITIAGSKISSDSSGLVNFPVLVNLPADADLKSFAKNDGSDILFTLAGDPKVKLLHEIEKYDSTTGNLVAWVKVPKLSAGNDAKLYMYYGNSTAGSQQDSAGVWGVDNYAMVQHMNGNFVDSTSNINNGENVLNKVAFNPGGKIGEGAKFTNDKDYLDVANDDSLNITDQITLSAWIKPNNSLNGYPGIVSKRFRYTPENNTSKISLNDGYTLALFPQRNVGFVVQSEESNVSVYPISTSFVNDGKWHLVTGTYDGNYVKIYVDGVLNGQVPLSGKIKTHENSPLFIGQLQLSNLPYADYQYYGLMDEVRVLKTAMSAGWIKTEFENQNSPEKFYTVSAGEKF